MARVLKIYILDIINNKYKFQLIIKTLIKTPALKELGIFI